MSSPKQRGAQLYRQLPVSGLNRGSRPVRNTSVPPMGSRAEAVYLSWASASLILTHANKHQGEAWLGMTSRNPADPGLKPKSHDICTVPRQCTHDDHICSTLANGAYGIILHKLRKYPIVNSKVYRNTLRFYIVVETPTITIEFSLLRCFPKPPAIFILASSRNFLRSKITFPEWKTSIAQCSLKGEIFWAEIHILSHFYNGFSFPLTSC